MKIYFGISLVFLYIRSISSSPMNYVYYENPDLGYVAALSGPSAYTKTRFNGPKKFFVGNTNQKYMKLANEDAINSLFSVSKLSPNMFDPVIDTGNVYSPSDNKWQTNKPELSNQEFKNKDIRFVEIDHPTKSRDDAYHHNARYRVTPDTSIHEAQKSHLENKPMHPKNYFEYGINQNKRRAIKTIPKTQYDVNVPPIKETRLPIQQYGEKPHSKPAKDITYKQTEKKNNAQAMTTILDDMTQQALKRYENRQENRKRETQSTVKDEYLQPLINHLFNKENRVKFLDSKHIPARIGQNEEFFNNKPYALFYRGIDNLDHRDFYTGSVDNSLHNNVVESKAVLKDVTIERQKKRNARKISNIKLNRNTLDTDLI